MQRFRCAVCDKSYLRKRHLQRHMRDECIGIPPRFHCDHCESKFRRKYHLVRHMLSKHGIQMEPGPMKPGSSATNGSGSGTEGGGEVKSSKRGSDTSDGNNLATMAAVAAATVKGKGGKGGLVGNGTTDDSNDEKFSVNTLMVKQEVLEPVSSSQSMMYQNFKNLFFDYALKNVPAQMQNFRRACGSVVPSSATSSSSTSSLAIGGAGTVAVGGGRRGGGTTTTGASLSDSGRRSLLQLNDLLYDVKFSDLSKFLNAVGRYQCPRRDCDKNYKDASSLQRHIRYECGGMKKFRCVMCGKAFSQGSHLKRHLESGVCIKYYF
uniref:C2H2-type domain-containing protein n=1 Tax=Anopheles minimus TaxID=112268 RepID=A0A182WMF4_9DIPT